MKKAELILTIITVVPVITCIKSLKKIWNSDFDGKLVVYIIVTLFFWIPCIYVSGNLLGPILIVYAILFS